jgi:hypothetical protein
MRHRTQLLSVSAERAAGRRSRLPATLATAPIEVRGNWAGSLPHAALVVLSRMRAACLDGGRLVSDRQPGRLRVDNHEAGLPHVWLHPGRARLAWIVVNIGARDWSKLAYQFGHELGHVLANSWQPSAIPAVPCQWLEEALVEAFALRGLGRLADSWTLDPPFSGDTTFGAAIATYRLGILRHCAELAAGQGGTADLAAWFARHRGAIEAEGGLTRFAQAAVPAMLAEYEHPECLAALGALNRWPGRSGVPLEDFLRLWEASCAELRASARLPLRLRALLGLRATAQPAGEPP